MTDTTTTTAIVIAEAYDADEQLNQLSLYLQQGGIATPEQIASWQDDIGEKLGAIWAEAESQQNTALADYASGAWTTAQTLVAQAQATVNVTTAAVLAAKTLKGERDAAIEERLTLEDAVRNQDEDHPLVGDLIQAVQDDTYEAAEEQIGMYLEEQIYDDAYESLLVMLHEALEVNIETIRDVLHELRNHTTGFEQSIARAVPALSPAFIAQFGAMFTAAQELIEAAQPAREAESKRRAEERNRMVAEMHERYMTATDTADLDDDGYDTSDLDDDGYPADEYPE